jgi:hypothetical protein
MAAWWILSPGQVEQVIEIVRNRLLTFILELGELDFSFSEVATDAVPSAEFVLQVFNSNILGDHNILGIGETVVQSITQVVQKGNNESLRDYLIILDFLANLY